MIASISRYVATASTRMAWPYPTPSPKATPPTFPRSTATVPNVPISSSPPASDPVIWAAMYGTASRHGNLPVTASATVTAGLMCAPDVVPNE